MLLSNGGSSPAEEAQPSENPFETSVSIEGASRDVCAVVDSGAELNYIPLSLLQRLQSVGTSAMAKLRDNLDSASLIRLAGGITLKFTLPSIRPETFTSEFAIIDDRVETSVPQEIILGRTWIRQAISFYPSRLSVASSTSPSGLLQLLRQLRYMRTLEQQADIADLSIQEAKRSIHQAKQVERLTLLAFLFIPFSFASSFLGMNLKASRVLIRSNSEPEIWGIVGGFFGIALFLLYATRYQLGMTPLTVLGILPTICSTTLPALVWPAGIPIFVKIPAGLIISAGWAWFTIFWEDHEMPATWRDFCGSGRVRALTLLAQSVWMMALGWESLLAYLRTFW